MRKEGDERRRGQEGGGGKRVCEMRQKCKIQLWSRERLLVVCEPSIASLSRSSFC